MLMEIMIETKYFFLKCDMCQIGKNGLFFWAHLIIL